MANVIMAKYFKRLVDNPRVGGVDAASALLSEELGENVNKGAVSQVCNANSRVPMEWVPVLERAAGSSILTELYLSAFAYQGDDTPRDHHHIMSNMAGVLSLYAKALEDGKVDAQEAALLAPELARLMELIKPLAMPKLKAIS